MKLFISVLIICIVEIRADCLQFDQCVKNITDTFLTFGDYYSNIMFRARDYVEDLIPKFKLKYRAMNITVLNGPEICREKHLLTQRMGYYFKDSMNMCVVPEPNPNPEDVESIKNFNPATEEESGRAQYCSHLVPYFNIYCRYLDEVMATADNCDVLKNFDLLFKSKWDECNSGVNNNSSSINLLTRLKGLAKKIKNSISTPKNAITDVGMDRGLRATTNLFSEGKYLPTTPISSML